MTGGVVASQYKIVEIISDASNGDLAVAVQGLKNQNKAFAMKIGCFPNPAQ